MSAEDYVEASRGLEYTSMREVRERLLTAIHAQLFTFDGEGILNGTVILAELSKDTLEGSLDGLLQINDVAHQQKYYLDLNSAR